MTSKLAIISFLAGIALGLRYKVVILLRAVVLVMLFAMIVGIGRGDRFLSIIMAMALAAASIQVGYLVGAQIRAAVG
jgi:general stress protein CsbA